MKLYTTKELIDLKREVLEVCSTHYLLPPYCICIEFHCILITLIIIHFVFLMDYWIKGKCMTKLPMIMLTCKLELMKVMVAISPLSLMCTYFYLHLILLVANTILEIENMVCGMLRNGGPKSVKEIHNKLLLFMEGT